MLPGRRVNQQTAETAGMAAIGGATPLSQNEYKVQLAKVAVRHVAGLESGGFFGTDHPPGSHQRRRSMLGYAYRKRQQSHSPGKKLQRAPSKRCGTGREEIKCLSVISKDLADLMRFLAALRMTVGFTDTENALALSVFFSVAEAGSRVCEISGLQASVV